MTKDTKNILTQLCDPNLSPEHRSGQLVDILEGARKGESQEYEAVAEEVFRRLENSGAEDGYRQRRKQLDDAIAQFDAAPLRPATFIELSNLDGSSSPHALVNMGNGELAYVVVQDLDGAQKLKIGDRVMLDAKMKFLLHPALSGLYFGQEARLERKVDDKHIEVVTHQDDRKVLLAGPELIAAIASRKVVPGASIVMDKGELLAICAVPVPEEKFSHFRFLDRGPVPDVRVERDIGNPPRVIAQVALHLREEMTRPDLRRKFRLRPCITRLLAGVSGCGKTLAVQAIHRLMYEIMAEVTGVPLAELPPRVFRMKSSQMLSMWFGESDKNIDRLFDEVETLADQPLKVKNKEHRLPVMVVLEEADGLGRARGGDSIYDRIMTVILQRMDPNREGLANKLVVFLSTTNEAGIVDPAFLRRIGGSVEHFGRLDRKGFIEILGKHIAGLPAKGRKMVEAVAARLFDNGDQGIVELTYQGQPEPVIKYRRDFLTGALIDRAVQQAAEEAWQRSLDGSDHCLSEKLLEWALENQVLSVAHQLNTGNVHNYTDLPEGVRVARICRLAKPGA